MDNKKNGGMKRVLKYVGVQYYESSKRRHQGKPDRCFYFTIFKDGKLYREKVGWTSEGYTAELASRLRSERIRQMRHGEEIPNGKNEHTFVEAWAKYDAWLAHGKAWPDDDRQRYGKYLKDRFEGMPFSSISPFDLERLKSDLIKAGLADATIKHVLVLFRQIWNKAISWKLTTLDNPVKSIKIPRVSNRRERFLSHEEASLLLETLQMSSQTLYEMSVLSLMTGMRAGEILSLKWGDVDLESGTINLQVNQGTIKRAARPIWLNDEAVKILMGKKRGESSGLVFPSLAGNRRVKIQRSFRDVVNRIGLNDGVTDRRDKVTFHTLRHTFASWLAMDGVPLYTIKELMGHSTIAMSERYAKLIPDTKRSAVGRLGLPRNQSSKSAPDSACNAPGPKMHNERNDRS